MSSAATVVPADFGYDKPCRVPRFLARGEFNRFDFDSDVLSKLEQNSDGKWELDIMDDSQLRQHVRPSQTPPFADFDCRRRNGDSVASAERLPHY